FGCFLLCDHLALQRRKWIVPKTFRPGIQSNFLFAAFFFTHLLLCSRSIDCLATPQHLYSSDNHPCFASKTLRFTLPTRLIFARSLHYCSNPLALFTFDNMAFW